MPGERDLAAARVAATQRTLLTTEQLVACGLENDAVTYKPDFMWRSHRLIVELDSYGFHGGPDAFQNDREKDLYYRDAGFDVLRFTRAHVVYEPTVVLVRLAQALALRAPA